MAEPDNIVLAYLRRLDQKVDGLVDDVRDIKVRMTNVEEGLALIDRRMERIEPRLDRIESALGWSTRRYLAEARGASSRLAVSDLVGP